MGISGDFDVLARFAKQLEKIAHAPDLIAGASHPRLRRSLGGSMGANQDPYGNSWPPPKVGGRIKTEGYLAQIGSEVEGSKIEFTVSEPLVYHHAGVAGHMPPRPILPNSGQGLPPNWQSILRAEAKKLIAAVAGDK